MTPSHAAVLLAAGASSRLGRSKQLIEIDGESLIRRAARLALTTDPIECVVVLGHDVARIGREIAGLPLTTICIENFADGVSASLRAGIGALGRSSDGALIMLTDQPGLDAAHLMRLRAAWRSAPARAVASRYAGVLGVPAMLPRGWFDRVAGIEGDVGARALLRGDADTIAIDAPALARDVDTPADLDRNS